MARGDFLLGLALGAGAVLLGTRWREARPVAKAALRGGVAAYAVARRAAADIGEEIEDLIAETAHEIAEEKAALETAPPAASNG